MAAQSRLRGTATLYRQEDLTINGHAYETLIYAEYPGKEFLPIRGRGNLTCLQSPEEGPHVRVDTSVLQGDEVSIFYDSMSLS